MHRSDKRAAEPEMLPRGEEQARGLVSPLRVPFSALSRLLPSEINVFLFFFCPGAFEALAPISSRSPSLYLLSWCV